MALMEWNNAPNVQEDYDSDGESRRERNDYDIEKAILEFEDEPPIRHDEVPDTESDSEEEEDNDGNLTSLERQRTPITPRDEVKRGDGNMFQGQRFINGVAFKEAVLDYALKTSRNIKRERYDKDKLSYVCAGKNCKWRIYCSTTGSSTKWEVKVYKNHHTCEVNGMCDMMKVPVIARLFVHKIRDEPKYFMPMKIEELIMTIWRINVSRAQCQAARNKALTWIAREYEEQFARIRDYGAEILESNPNSSVEIGCLKSAEGLDLFNRFYVCFDNIRRTWKDTCRPIIGVDGCFLRSTMKGQLLVALGRDADNAIYPIAWGVVQVENTENWCWFVRKIKTDLGLNDGDNYILVSDRQKGLIKAVEIELPKIEHRMCVRHIYANLKARHGKKPEMKGYIWHLAWSYNEGEFIENLENIRKWDFAVYEDVVKEKPRTWCRAFYKLGNYCEDVENNSTESWNSSVVTAREKPLVPMLETIARLTMVRIAKRDVIASDHDQLCTPYVIEFLEKILEKEKPEECKVYRSTNNTWLGIHNASSYRVSLSDRTCTCRRWDITGIPCVHAYAVILKVKGQPQEYVCHWFRTTMWRRTYSEGLIPIRSIRFWPVGDEPRVHRPPSPEQPGRKKGDKGDKGEKGDTNRVRKKDKVRKKGKNESPLKKKQKLMKRVMHCGVCGEANHNSRFHNPKKKSKKNSVGESSQVEASQVEPSITQTEN